MTANRLTSVAFGLAVGVAVRLILPGRHAATLPVTAGLSLLGALVAGLLAERVVPVQAAQPARYLFSALGAIAVLLGYAVIAH